MSENLFLEMQKGKGTELMCVRTACGSYTLPVAKQALQKKTTNTGLGFQESTEWRTLGTTVFKLHTEDFG